MIKFSVLFATADELVSAGRTIPAGLTGGLRRDATFGWCGTGEIATALSLARCRNGGPSGRGVVCDWVSPQAVGQAWDLSPLTRSALY
jgi:hypothetical protein